jgi:ferritin-like protein
MSSESLHEPADLLSEETKNLHRAIVSLVEELEAVDWYQQRAEACTDPDLKAVLIHNKNEEIEHACMNLEWLRRRSPEIDERLRTYLFAEGPITEIEAKVKAAQAAGEKPTSAREPRPAANAAPSNLSSSATSSTTSSSGSLDVGSLRSR